jgi:hypothetical protein
MIYFEMRHPRACGRLPGAISVINEIPPPPDANYPGACAVAGRGFWGNR